MIHVDAGRVDILDVCCRRAIKAAHQFNVIGHRQWSWHRRDRFFAHGLHRLAIKRHIIHIKLPEDRPDSVETRRAGRKVDAQLGVDRMHGEVCRHLESLQHQLADVQYLLGPAEMKQLLRDDGRTLELLQGIPGLRVAQVRPLAFLVRRRHQHVDHHHLCYTQRSKLTLVR